MNDDKEMNSQENSDEQLLCDACKHRKDLHMEDFGCWHTDGLTYCQCHKVFNKK